MTHPFRHLVVTLVCLMLGVSGAWSTAQASWASLYLDSLDDELHLTWVPTTEWPADVAGVALMKAPKGPGGAPVGGWMKAHKAPILPTMVAQRDWSLVHPDPLEQQRLRAKLAGLSLRGVPSFASNDQEFIAYLRNMSPQESRGLRANLLQERDSALIFGFAVNITRPDYRPGFFYAIFPVRSDGSVGSQPIAMVEDIFVPDDDPRFEPELTFTPVFPRGLRIEWRFPAKLYDDLGLRPFDIFAPRVNEEGETVLKLIGITLNQREGEEIVASFYDASADDTMPQDYLVVTRHKTGRERHRAPYHYAPPRPEDEVRVDPPGQPKPEQTHGLDIKVSWTFAEAHEKYVLGFELQRRKGLTEGAFETISGTLAPTVREVLDKAPKVFKEPLTYRIVAYLRDGTQLFSASSTILYLDTRLPPKVSGLTAAFKVAGGKRFVALSWDRVPGDEITDAWVIDSDEREVGTQLRQAWIPLLQKSSYDYPIETLDARPYSFQVSGLSRLGLEGPPTKVTVNMVPGQYLPPVRIARFELIDAGRRVRLHWDYEPISPLRGFQLKVDGKRVASADTLHSEARSWTSEVMPAASSRSYSIRAWAENDMVSEWSPPQAYRLPAGQGLPVMPKRFRVQVEHWKGKDSLKLLWQPKNDGLTVRYIVRGAEGKGELQELHTMDWQRPPVYRHPYDPTVAATYRFELLGETARGIRGPAATVTHKVVPALQVADTPPPEPTPAPADKTQAPEASSDASPWLLLGTGLLLGLLALGLFVRLRRMEQARED